MKIRAWLAVVVILLSAAGCGFRMKAPILPDAVQSVSLLGKAGIKRDLEDALDRMGIEVVSKEADMVVLLEDYRREDWEVAFNARVGRAETEFSLSVLVSVRLWGEVRLPPTRLQVMRSLLDNPGYPISASEEQRVFGAEMKDALVDEIIRAMEMAVRNQQVADADPGESTR